MPLAARTLAYDDTNQVSERCLMIEQDPRSRSLVPRALGVGKILHAFAPSGSRLRFCCIPEHPIRRAVALGSYFKQWIPAPAAVGS
jgi:ABC-type antimicrobial peptide transport system ATPase subunit